MTLFIRYNYNLKVTWNIRKLRYNFNINKLYYFIINLRVKIGTFENRTYEVKWNGVWLIMNVIWWLQAMHRLGARRLIIVGVLPLGCIPLIKTIRNVEGCDKSLNSVAYSFNAKLLQQLNNLKTKLGLKTALVDVYGMIQRAVVNPKKYG